MEIIRRIHYWTGLMGIILFLLTGQYMHHVYSHLQDLDDGTRMLFRSAHIYFFLASLVNLVFGVYLNPKLLSHGKLVQLTISTLVLVAPVLFLVGFFTEPHLKELARPYSRLGVYALFGATVLVIVVGLKKNG